MSKNKLNPRTVYGHCDGESGRATCRMSGSTARALSMGGRDAAPYVRDAIDRGEILWVGDDATLSRLVKSTGAWDDLGEVSPATIRERAAWLAACDISEMPDMYL